MLLAGTTQGCRQVALLCWWYLLWILLWIPSHSGPYIPMVMLQHQKVSFTISTFSGLKNSLSLHFLSKSGDTCRRHWGQGGWDEHWRNVPLHRSQCDAQILHKDRLTYLLWSTFPWLTQAYHVTFLLTYKIRIAPALGAPVEWLTQHPGQPYYLLPSSTAEAGEWNTYIPGFFSDRGGHDMMQL